jgi:hypothetical protein
VRGQRGVVLCDVTCERTKICSYFWCDLWEDKENHKELHLFVLSQVTSQRTTEYISVSSHKSHQRTTSLCPLTSHITKNYSSVSSHKSPHKGQRDVAIGDVTCERTKRCSSLMWLVRGQRDILCSSLWFKELHLFILSQVTSQITTALCPLTSHITNWNYISLCPHNVTSERTKRCSYLWCDLWEDKEM